MVGKAIEPVLTPLGLDWRMGVGIVAGIGAKELVLSSMGVMYGIDDDLENAPVLADSTAQRATYVTEEQKDSYEAMSEEGKQEVKDIALQNALKKTITPAAALGFLIFVLMYFPCFATFIAIKNETGGW